MDGIVVFSKQFSTLLFFTFFMIVLYMTYRKDKKVEIEEMKYTIFDEEELRRIK